MRCGASWYSAEAVQQMVVFCRLQEAASCAVCSAQCTALHTLLLVVFVGALPLREEMLDQL